MNSTFSMIAHEEANFYLVSMGLKPAAYFNFDLPFEDKEDKPTAESILSLYCSYFDTFGFPYSLFERNSSNRKIISTFIGSNQKNLDNLVAAKNGSELGIALGYPQSAVKAYEENRAVNLLVAMAEAKQAKADIPSWLAYVFYAPDRLNFVTGDVCETTEKRAKDYLKFVQENNPVLAEMVEYNLRAEFEGNLPISWERIPSGKGYNLVFDSTKPLLSLKGLKFTFETKTDRSLDIFWPFKLEL